MGKILVAGGESLIGSSTGRLVECLPCRTQENLSVQPLCTVKPVKLLTPLSRPSSGAMEITRANFKERLPDMEAAIDTAAFLAIDGEFTGLSADKGNSPFDLPHERWAKLPPVVLYPLCSSTPPSTCLSTPPRSTCG